MSGGQQVPEIEVIVLCKNEGDAFRPCLERILAQEGAGSFSVSVIDSGSTDGSVEVARSLGARLIQVAPNEFHHARTRNLGAEASRSAILVYTNGHTLPVGRSWLARLTAPLREGGAETAGVYGRQLPREDAYPMERFMLSRLYGSEPRVQRARQGQAVTLTQTMFSTVNCALRRDLWRARPFSDRVTNTEDQEWTRYWLEHGHAIVYEPEAAVIHSHNHTYGQAFRRYYGFGAAAGRSYLPGGARATAGFTLSGLRYLAEEGGFLARNGHGRWLPRAAAYEAVKGAGWMLGRQRERLPAWMRRRAGDRG